MGHGGLGNAAKGGDCAEAAAPGRPGGPARQAALHVTGAGRAVGGPKQGLAAVWSGRRAAGRVEDAFEQGGTEVTPIGSRQDRDDGLPRAFRPMGQTQGDGGRGSAGFARKDALLPRKAQGGGDGLGSGDGLDRVDQ